MNPQHDGITKAVIGLAAEHDPAQLEVILDMLSNGQLRSLAAALAARVARDEKPDQTTSTARSLAPAVTSSVTPPSVQDISFPAHVCDVAIEAAARTFDTTPEAVLSTARVHEVSDARAVAMTAARTNGLSLPQIAEHFGRDHSSVIHAVRRTGDRPRLAAAASAIAEDITNRYKEVTEDRPALSLVRGPETAAVAHKSTPQDRLVGAAIDAAARKFGTDPELLRGPDRTRMVSDVRAVAMTAARINGMSLPKIAAEFGDRHHTAVLQATRRIEKTPPLRELAERIAKDIPTAESPGNVGGVRRTAMLDGPVTTTPGRGPQSDRAASEIAPAPQPALAPRR